MGKNKTYIIAELSANHNNDFGLAERTVVAMHESGADAVKVQTYTADSLTMDVDNEFFGPRKEGPWKGLRPYDVFSEGAMPYEWQPRLKALAEGLGLEFFSSPFDLGAVDFLESMDVPRYKIASFEITDIPLIRYAASKGRPMIISTGVAEIGDIRSAVDACRGEGNNDITLLKCTSQYPATVGQANLMAMLDMKERFGVKVGLSDHTMGSLVPTVAVALGAEVVEKHFILDRSLGGPDSSFSMEPSEFRAMVDAVRGAESSLGRVTYDVSEKDKLRRRSLFVAKDISQGEQVTMEHLKSVRPGHGAPPELQGQVVGRTARRDLKKGTPVNIDDFV